MIFAMGYLGSRIISFLMLPLYTYKLTTGEYGTIDLLTTTVAFLLPVISLSIFDATLRFAMEKEADVSKVLTNSFVLTFVSSLILIIAAVIAYLINILYFFLILLLILQSYQSLFSQYANGIGKTKIFASNGLVLSFLTAGLNILFLVPMNLGLYGYLISTCLAYFISNIYLILSLNIFNEINFASYDLDYLKKMIRYSIPLIPNSVAWWITTAVGRYFILFFVGTAGNGLYAVANKIPTLLTVFTTIFSQSWQLSAIESFNSEEREGFFSNVYSIYSQLLIIGCSGIMFLLKPIFLILVSKDFFSSWKFAPFLLLSVITSSLSSFLGSQYIAAKETRNVLKTTVVGGVLTITLNVILVPIMGVNGVGLGSFLSFFIVWLIRERDLQRFFSFSLDKKKFYFGLIIIILQYICLIHIEGALLYLVNGSLMLIVLINNFSLLKKLFSQLNLKRSIK